MGVEFRTYLIPRPNSFRPSTNAAVALVAALRDDGWLLQFDDPNLAKLPFQQSRLYKPARAHGYFAQTMGKRDAFCAPLPQLFDEHAERDLIVTWPVESLGASGLRYPLEPLPFDDPVETDECYYEFQLQFGRDFIYRTSESIDPFAPAPICRCGREFEYEPESVHDPFYSSRLAARCPSCATPFDPTQLAAAGRDAWTGEPVDIAGGATYRFAVVIDCGKYCGERPLKIHPRLKALIERTLDIATHEIAEFY